MESRVARRITRELTKEEEERLRQLRAQIAEELPDLIVRDRMRKEASEECTLSGELRRAVHAGGIPLTILAAKVGCAPLILDEFLTGERTLRSDIMDRLAMALGCKWQLQRETVKA